MYCGGEEVGMVWVLLAMGLSLVFCLGWVFGAAVAHSGESSGELDLSERARATFPWMEPLAPDAAIGEPVSR